MLRQLVLLVPRSSWSSLSLSLLLCLRVRQVVGQKEGQEEQEEQEEEGRRCLHPQGWGEGKGSGSTLEQRLRE